MAQQKIISLLNARWHEECFMFGLMVVWTAHATASGACCTSFNQLVPVKIMVLSMSLFIYYFDDVHRLVFCWKDFC